MLARFYKEELDYLRGMAREFADAHQGVVANALLTPGADPDVERLLEGFAFLSARVRQRIDDDFPEIVHTLAGLLWPQFLRPTPSLCIVEFTPELGKVHERRPVKAHAEMLSVSRPIEEAPKGQTAAEARCQFRTCWDLDVLPLTVAAATLDQTPDGNPAIALTFRLLPGARFEELFPERSGASVRLFLHEGATAVSLLEAFARRVDRVEVYAREGGARVSGPATLGAGCLAFPGLDPKRSLLPESRQTFTAFGLLRDYFLFPERFQFVDVTGLDQARHLGIDREFEIAFRLTGRPENIRRIEPGNFRLGCVPAVNLFEHQARPIVVGRERSEYPLVPDSDDPGVMETVDVRGLGGIVAGTGQERTFTPLYSLSRTKVDGSGDQVYYKTRVRPSVSGKATETWISLVDAGEAVTVPPVETVYASLTCSNGSLPAALAPGDLCEAGTTPTGVTFRDITRIMPPVPPPIDGKAAWKLVSLIATSYLSIADADNLRTLLRLMDVRSVHDRTASRRLHMRLDAIESVTVASDDWMVRGRPVRGRAITIVLRDRQFGGLADVQLFGSVLDIAFTMFSSVNSHTRLTIVAKESVEELRWKPRHGAQILQ